MLLKLWRMCKNVFPWRPQATKCKKNMLAAVMTRGTTSRAVDSVRFDQRNRMNHMHNILAYVMS